MQLVIVIVSKYKHRSKGEKMLTEGEAGKNILFLTRIWSLQNKKQMVNCFSLRPSLRPLEWGLGYFKTA